MVKEEETNCDILKVTAKFGCAFPIFWTKVYGKIILTANSLLTISNWQKWCCIVSKQPCFVAQICNFYCVLLSAETQWAVRQIAANKDYHRIA